jgi:hypothetical protein
MNTFTELCRVMNMMILISNGISCSVRQDSIGLVMRMKRILHEIWLALQVTNTSHPGNKESLLCLCFEVN